MALAEKYVVLFQKECLNLSNVVLINLQKLLVNPTDKGALENVLQAADTIKGDSRFINHKELEHASMSLVRTFNEVTDTSAKSKEVEFFIEIFKKIINQKGIPF